MVSSSTAWIRNALFAVFLLIALLFARTDARALLDQDGSEKDMTEESFMASATRSATNAAGAEDLGAKGVPKTLEESAAELGEQIKAAHKKRLAEAKEELSKMPFLERYFGWKSSTED